MRITLYVVAALLIVTIAVVVSRTPELERNWDPDVRVLAEVAIAADGSQFTLTNIRNWRYADDGPTSREYFSETYRLADLRGMYLYEQILDPRGWIAHTFVVFEFNDSYAHPRIGVSVETRRELGEQYSLLKGALRGFELTHTWASETDLVERRVRYLGYAITKYRIKQTAPHQQQYLLNFLKQTAALSHTPRWYNTITSNCTNVIINAANQVEPGFLPFDKSFILTGLADDYLTSRGVLAEKSVARIERLNIDGFVDRLHAR